MIALDQSRRGLQVDHDLSDIGQKLANKNVNPEQSRNEVPAAYATNEDEATAARQMQRREKAEGDRR